MRGSRARRSRAYRLPAALQRPLGLALLAMVGAYATALALVGWPAASGAELAGALAPLSALNVAAATLSAYLLRERAAVDGDGRLAWLAWGCAGAAATMGLHLLVSPVSTSGETLGVTTDPMSALYLLWHMGFAGCALAALGWPRPGRWPRTLIGGLWLLVAGALASRLLPSPDLVTDAGEYRALAVLLHLVIAGVCAAAAYGIWRVRRPQRMWGQGLVSASLALTAAELLLHAFAESRATTLWWASFVLRLAQFAFLAGGLLVALVALTRSLEGFTDGLLERLAGTSAVDDEVQSSSPPPAPGEMAAIVEAGLDVVFQPVLDLATGRVVGLEALSRFPSRPGVSPSVVFAEAAREGLAQRLELRAVEQALAEFDRAPADLWLAVNVSPTTAAAPELAELLVGGAVERVVIEITEHVPVEEYDILAAALLRLRDRGVRIAVDDAGAGFASFRHVVRLRPDIIKLDMSLTAGIDTDPVRRALAASIISFAESVHSLVVAEGIETSPECDVLAELGVPLGQGYLLGRPAPLPILEAAGYPGVITSRQAPSALPAAAPGS